MTHEDIEEMVSGAFDSVLASVFEAHNLEPLEIPPIAKKMLERRFSQVADIMLYLVSLKQEEIGKQG